MNTILRITKNTASLFIAQIIVSILSIVLSIFIARNLGDASFGKYSFASVFPALFAVFLDLGYNTLLIRDVARDKSLVDIYLNNILCMRVLLSPIIFALIVLTINLMNYPPDTKVLVYIFSICAIIASLSAVFKVTFRAFEKMEYDASITIIANLIAVLLGLLVLFLGYGLIGIVLAYLFSSILDVMLCFLICKQKYVNPKIEFNPIFWKETIKLAWPLSILLIFGIIYTRIDTLMLSIIKGDEVVGWYNAANNLVLSLKIIPMLFMNALFPLISNYYVSSTDSLKIAYEKSFKYLLILGLPLSLGIILLAERFITLLYGNQFFPSIIALRLLALDVLLVFLITCLGFILVSIDKQNYMAIFAGFAALINVIFNLILIPSYSYIGAAIATIAAQTVLFGLYFYFVSKFLYRLYLLKTLAKPLIACFAMVIIFYFFNEINIVGLVILEAIIYFIILYAINGFPREDIQLVIKSLKNSPM